MAKSADQVVDVAEFINYHLGGDIKNISKAKDFYLKLESTVTELHNKLSGSPVDDSNELSNLLYSVDKDIKRARLLVSKKDELIRDVNNHFSTITSETEHFRPDVLQITELEKYLKYFQWIQLSNKLGREMKNGLESSESKRKIVNSFAILSSMCKQVQSSSCKHLLNFVTETTQVWYTILKQRFGSEFDEILKQLKWPFIPSIPGVTPAPTYDVLCQFELLFSLLMEIQLPCELVARETSEFKNSEPLPLQFLLKSFRKRFNYHFIGNKKTNDINKPEWYLTNVSNWIRDHIGFLDRYVQPILTRLGYPHIIAKIVFISGLVELVILKMINDMPKILCEDSTLAHTINETLIFEKELRNHGFPMGRSSCLIVLTRDNCFGRWLNIEKKLAQDNLDQILSTESAWTIEYQDISEGVANKVPQCAEKFLTMILGITERYKILPLPGHRLKFLELQLELIDDFRLRLVQLLEHKNPLSTHFCAIINVIHYVTYVLKDWCETPFFLQMQYYRQQFLTMQKSLVARSQTSVGNRVASPAQTNTEEAMVSSVTSINKEVLDSIREIDSERLNFQELDETVFEDSVELFDHMKEEMLTKLADALLLEVKAKGYSYRHVKWFSIPLLKGSVDLSVSPGMCGILLILSTSLELLQRELALPIFTEIWQRMTTSLGKFFFDEVILKNRFSEGGATQLSYDMNRNLFSLFSEYTRKPENHFRKLKEACILLNLSKGSALLLQEVLNETNRATITSKSTSDSTKSLEEIGVHRLKPESALSILKLRLDLDTP